VTSTQDSKRKINVPDSQTPISRTSQADLELWQVRTSGVVLLASRGP
jgi:hypothetical protein